MLLLLFGDLLQKYAHNFLSNQVWFDGTGILLELPGIACSLFWVQVGKASFNIFQSVSLWKMQGACELAALAFRFDKKNWQKNGSIVIYIPSRSQRQQKPASVPWFQLPRQLPHWPMAWTVWRAAPLPSPGVGWSHDINVSHLRILSNKKTS